MSLAYAQDQGFANERERFGMILSVPDYKHEELWRWMQEDGSKAGLEAILKSKRKVGRHER